MEPSSSPYVSYVQHGFSWKVISVGDGFDNRFIISEDEYLLFFSGSSLRL
jgi:hypothetical protein